MHAIEFNFFRWKQCPGIIGLDEYQFTCLWQNQSIHFASYSNVLALVHRIKESQNILHDVQCVACKVTTITGIRFKCQQCRNLSLCFECFCKGYSSSRHEISHRMYEMSTIVSYDAFFWSPFNYSIHYKCAPGIFSESNRTNYAQLLRNSGVARVAIHLIRPNPKTKTI